jgi:hypothetical protein
VYHNIVGDVGQRPVKVSLTKSHPRSELYRIELTNTLVSNDVLRRVVKPKSGTKARVGPCQRWRPSWTRKVEGCFVNAMSSEA